jgi:hypothetical protein
LQFLAAIDGNTNKKRINTQISRRDIRIRKQADREFTVPDRNLWMNLAPYWNVSRHFIVEIKCHFQGALYGHARIAQYPFVFHHWCRKSMPWEYQKCHQ